MQVASSSEGIRQLAYDLYSWAKAGVLDRVFKALQEEGFLQIRIEAISLDSTHAKVHPDGTGALKKTARKVSANPKEDGRVKFIWLPQMLNRL